MTAHDVQVTPHRRKIGPWNRACRLLLTAVVTFSAVQTAYNGISGFIVPDSRRGRLGRARRAGCRTAPRHRRSGSDGSPRFGGGHLAPARAARHLPGHGRASGRLCPPGELLGRHRLHGFGHTGTTPLEPRPSHALLLRLKSAPWSVALQGLRVRGRCR
jgi:hypothetical protein